MTQEEEQESQSDSLVKATNALETVVGEYSMEAIRDLPEMQQALKVAYGIRGLQKYLDTEAMDKLIMPLAGSPLGFLTDKDKDSPANRYPQHIVRDCVIDALLRGFRIIGNEMNIIAGRAYYTKAGYERKVREFPGLSELKEEIGGHEMLGNSTAAVPFTLRWVREGVAECVEFEKSKEKDLRIQVRVNSGMGPDAIIGKATRKAYYRAYRQLIGSAVAGDEEPISPTAEFAQPPRSAFSGGRPVDIQPENPYDDLETEVIT